MFFLTLPLSGIYLIYNGVYTNIYIIYGNFQNDIIQLFNTAILFSILGYLVSLVGYGIATKNLEFNLYKIKFENKSQISNFALNIIIISFFLIGMSNFLLNMYYISNGNIIEYFTSISRRKYQFTESGTTIFYNFLYISIFIWLFKILREKADLGSKIFFSLALVFSISVKLSQGRITQTLVYILSFVIIFYFYNQSIGKKNNKTKYFISLLLTGVFGIVFYSFRLLSDLKMLGIKHDNIGEFFLDFLNRFGDIIVGKGNTPNIPILMKIIDSWENDIGFLYGSSFFSWIFSFISANEVTANIKPSEIIKQSWYQGVLGGALPPTGIGEMFANFGFLGIILGMFLFGVLMGYTYKITLLKGNYWILVVYVQVTCGFYLIYAKGEFDNFSLWTIIPVLIALIPIKILSLNKMT